MKIIKLITVLLLLSAAVGCAADVDDVKLIPLENWQNYQVIRPDTAEQEIVTAAVGIKRAIQEKNGTALHIDTDWVMHGVEVPTGTPEILVGDTNRAESGETMLYRDYKVEFVGNRVIIDGGSGAAVAEAAEWFIANCIGETISVPAKAYRVENTYEYGAVQIEGISLTDFTMPKSVRFAEQTEALRLWIAEKTGTLLAAEKSEHNIVIAENPSLGMLEISVSMRGGDVMLEIGTDRGMITHVAELFCQAVAENTDNSIQLPGKVNFEMDQIRTNASAQIAEWRKMTDARIREILASPNMQIPDGKTVYYLSPDGDDSADGKTPATAWKSLKKLNSVPMESGCYVCFERGGLWRGQLSAKAGVTYTAYGEGDKPKIYASPLNGADESLWRETDTKNIWVFSEAWQQDVGTLVFDHGKAHAIKCVIRTEADGSTFNNTTGEPFRTYRDLTTDLHFYHDYSGTGKLYLYSEGNPGGRFDSIEFNIKQNVVAVGGNSGVTVDNLCIKYGGAHGVGAGTVNDLTVQNCEFGWIGGSIQAEGIFGRNYGTRYGNAVEIYGGCDTYTVTDNYIYQIYDAGITQQVGLSSNPDNIKYQKNMTYARNVIEYCNYSIEYFISGCVPENPSRMENFLIEDNFMWYAAEGFCEQRPDLDQGAHIKSWSGANRNRATGFTVRNNLMCASKDMLVQIMSGLYNPDGSDSLPVLSGNNFVGKADGQLGTVAMDDVTRQI